MSHFVTLVISDEPLDKEALRPILQPWHEFECTGTRDQYVVEVDKTDEVLKQFNSPVTVLRLADGSIADRYDDRFKTLKVESYVVDRIRRDAKEMTENYSDEQIEEMVRAVVSRMEEDPDNAGRHNFRDKWVPPEGSEEVEMPADEARRHGLGYLTMAQCAEDYFGATTERDGRFYDLTNPNKKWDYWVVGGRWTGMLALDHDPVADPDNSEVCFLCAGTGKRKDMEVQDGCNGCRGTGKSVKFPSKWKQVGNIAQLRDVPVEAIRTSAEAKALKEYDRFTAIAAGRDFPTWDEVRKARTPPGQEYPSDWEATRRAFNEHPVIVELQAAAGRDYVFDFTELVADLKLTRAERAEKARLHALCPYSFVRDGKWFARGTMGWFGVPHDEEDHEAWARDFAKMIDELPGETWLAVVDCHI